MLLVIDNYDSFTYNLVQYFGELGAEMEIFRNDEITLERIAELSPERICVSPGPCTPNEAGISNDVIREFGPKLPVSLGLRMFQSMAGTWGNLLMAASVLALLPVALLFIVFARHIGEAVATNR